MIDAHPLDDKKNPIPNVMKNAGVILVAVRIGVRSSTKFPPSTFANNDDTKSFDIFKYDVVYAINVIVGTNDKNRKNAICPGNTSISGRQKASQNRLKNVLVLDLAVFFILVVF